jgi:two-component system nitrate/nitrite response regulator NarL
VAIAEGCGNVRSNDKAGEMVWRGATSSSGQEFDYAAGGRFNPDGSDPSGRSRPTILVVDRHLLMAESLAFCLNLKGFQVDVAVPSPEGGLEGILPSTWDVVILNIELETQDDISRFVPLLSSHGPVVALTARTDRLPQAWCIEAGAVALADKEQPFGNLIDIVQRIIGGERIMGSRERETLLELGRRHTSEVHRRRAPFLDLTDREQVVLTHLLDGQAVRTIARLSAVSESTIRSQIRSIFRKLGVNSQLRAVSLARQVGWTAEVQGRMSRPAWNPGDDPEQLNHEATPRSECAGGT